MIRHFIVNAKAGRGRPLKEIKKLVALGHKIGLQENKDYFVHEPKSQIETLQIAREYSNIEHNVNKGSEVIIYSVGGDGTNFAVVNGMVNSKSKLSVIGAGTGNDFKRSIDRNTRYVNLGYVNGQYFLNAASIGLDVVALIEANRLKNQGLKLPYAKGITKALFNYQGIDLTIDGEPKKTTMIAICNGKFYGSGISIAPQAILNDDLFDIYHFAEAKSSVNVAIEFTKLLLKVHGNSKKVVAYKRAKEIIITSPKPIYYNLDGEVFIDQEFHFKIAGKKIELYPQEEDKIFQKMPKKFN